MTDIDGWRDTVQEKGHLKNRKKTLKQKKKKCLYIYIYILEENVLEGKEMKIFVFCQY